MAVLTIRQQRKLVGIGVILVHRSLDNPVQSAEYLLFAEELYRAGESALSDPVHEVSQDVEESAWSRLFRVLGNAIGSSPGGIGFSQGRARGDGISHAAAERPNTIRRRLPSEGSSVRVPIRS